MKYKGKVDGYYLVNYLADMESKSFICQCDSPEHQLTFNYFPDERGEGRLSLDSLKTRLLLETYKECY